MEVVLIVLLAIILILLMCLYLFIDSICSDDLQMDMEIEQKIIENYEKNKKNSPFN